MCTRIVFKLRKQDVAPQIVVGDIGVRFGYLRRSNTRMRGRCRQFDDFAKRRREFVALVAFSA